MHAILCQRVHWMDTKYLKTRLDFVVIVYSQALSGAITSK